MPVTINGSAGVTTNSGAVYDSIQRGTSQATTSGTAFNFTSIPSWVKRITIMFANVSLSGTDNLLVQLGDSGGLETTGYVASSAFAINAGTSGGTQFTTGYGVTIGSAANAVSGAMVITNITGNVWVAALSGGFDASAAAISGGGTKTLSDTLTQLTVTRTGTNTFDAGTINILFE